MSIRTLTTLAFAGLLSVGMAATMLAPQTLAQDTTATAPAVVYTPAEAVAARQAMMKLNGMTLKGAATLTGNDAVAAMTLLSANFAQYPALFAEGLTTSDSKALPLIWEDWAGFTGIIDQSKAAAEAGIVAAQTGALVAYADALGAIGKGCGECHGKYRGK